MYNYTLDNLLADVYRYDQNVYFNENHTGAVMWMFREVYEQLKKPVVNFHVLKLTDHMKALEWYLKTFEEWYPDSIIVIHERIILLDLYRDIRSNVEKHFDKLCTFKDYIYSMMVWFYKPKEVNNTK